MSNWDWPLICSAAVFLLIVSCLALVANAQTIYPDPQPPRVPKEDTVKAQSDTTGWYEKWDLLGRQK